MQTKTTEKTTKVVKTTPIKKTEVILEDWKSEKKK